MFKAIVYSVIVLFLVSCADAVESSDEETSAPTPLNELTNIEVLSALLHNADFEGASFKLSPSDSTVRVFMQDVMVDSGSYSIDSNRFVMELKSHQLPIVYFTHLKNGILTELIGSENDQVLTVNTN